MSNRLFHFVLFILACISVDTVRKRKNGTPIVVVQQEGRSATVIYCATAGAPRNVQLPEGYASLPPPPAGMVYLVPLDGGQAVPSGSERRSMGSMNKDGVEIELNEVGKGDQAV